MDGMLQIIVDIFVIVYDKKFKEINYIFFLYYYVFYVIMIQFLFIMIFIVISFDWIYLNVTFVGWFEGENRCWGKVLLILFFMGIFFFVCEFVLLLDICLWQIKFFFF